MDRRIYYFHTLVVRSYYQGFLVQPLMKKSKTSIAAVARSVFTHSKYLPVFEMFVDNFSSFDFELMSCYSFAHVSNNSPYEKLSNAIFHLYSTTHSNFERELTATFF
jgi:hypothetical protein